MNRVYVMDDSFVRRRWFDKDKAMSFTEPKEWDGQNMVGKVLRSPWATETLYRTKSTDWVRAVVSTRAGGLVPPTYRFVSPEEAYDWLRAAGFSEEADRYLSFVRIDRAAEESRDAS